MLHELRVARAEPSAPIVVLESLVKRFGSFAALSDINLSVAKGEKIVLCGPSGSGKSTLIRCINRIEKHDGGRIVIDGVELTDRMADINSVRCEVGMVFQSFNLFPHLSVVENCMLAPMKVRGLSRSEAHDRAIGLLRKVRIHDQAEQISRASLGRSAAARSYRTCPVHAAENHAVRRAHLRARSGDGQGGARNDGGTRAEGMTMVCVTHEMGFAREVADRVIFMDGAHRRRR